MSHRLQHSSLAALALTFLASATFAAGANGAEGVYVANAGSSGNAANTLSQYTIGTGGALTADSPATVASGHEPEQIAVSPNGHNLYATTDQSATISQYSVAANGVLTPGATVNAGADPSGIAVTPNGEFVYVVNTASPAAQAIAQYTVGAGGVLPSTPTQSFSDADQGEELAVSANGQYLYVTNHAPNSVSVYSIASNGTLTFDTNVTSGDLSYPTSIIVSPNGLYVYVADYDGGVSQYTTAGASLDADSTPTAATGQQPGNLAISPNGRYVYLTNEYNGVGGNTVSQYTVGSGGELQVDTPTTVPAGEAPVGVVVSPDGDYVFVDNDVDGTISQYTVNANGTLTPNTAAAPSGLNEAQGIAVGPDLGPAAAFAGTPAQAGAASTFTSDSTDPDEPITTQTWSFGDGTTATGASVTHVFGTPGTYAVTLTVNDAAGCSATYPFFAGEAGPFSGQLSACSPDAAAQLSQNVTIPGPGIPTFANIKHKGPTVTATVSCVGTAIQTCTGTFSLTTLEHLTGHKLTAVTASKKKKKPKKLTRTVTLASATYTLDGAGSTTLTVTLSKTGKQLLAKYHKLPVKLTLTPTGSVAPIAAKAITITPTKPKPKHHRR
jgi:DNA-binding beta-propeller fold protein YncE